MARGRKKKTVTDVATDLVQTIINSGETDKAANTIYEAPKLLDPEAAKGFESVEYNIADEYKSSHINGVHWDVSLDDAVEYFDSNLSYELTGYRPVNETSGLDFQVSWFTEAKDIKLKTGVYCSFPPGSKKYTDYWKEQVKRCNFGYVSHGYRLTGDNYFFLNFYRLKDVEVEVAGIGRITGFPRFFSKQYEYFHYIDLCERTGKDVCALKARGVGFSEIAASLGVRLYSTVRESHVIYSAFSDDFLSAVLRKCWEQLEFLNSDTEGGLRHLRQRYNSDDHKRASKLNRQREESGFMSEILGITANAARKLRGDRADRLFFEESGSNPILTKTYIQSKALVEIMGRKFGTRFVWGTGGDAGPALTGLSDMFYNPTGFNILPYRHNFTKTGDYVLSAYFIPAFTFVNRPGYIDDRGVSNTEKSKEFYIKQRTALLDKPKEYMLECAEFCFTPEDALALEGDNDFDTVILQEQLSQIVLHKVGERPETGFLEYKFKGTEHREDNIAGFKWIPDKNGKISILEHPLRDAQNRPYRNLYVAGIDSIDLGKDDTSEATKNPSDFCIVIKKRIRGLELPKYVAIYKDRPKDIREAYKIALRLLEYYNCKAVLEKSKVTIQTYFRDRKKDTIYLMRRPRATLADKQRGMSKEFGVPATEDIIRHGLDLISAYINDYCQEIWFEDMLQELLKYSYENKRKYDIVAAMGMCEIGDEELAGIVPQQVEQYVDEWDDVGWYTDDRGYKRYGVIPKNTQKVPKFEINPKHDDGWIRTSDPRFNY